MGARPSSYKGGGGFLNNVDATIVGLPWTLDGPGRDEGRKAKAKKEREKQGKADPLYLLLTVRVDGAQEDVETHLWAGSSDRFAIAADGSELYSAEGQDDPENPQPTEPIALWKNCDAAVFVASMCDTGFDETLLSEDETRIDLRPMIGSRVRLVQRVDLDATKRLGKRKDPKTGREYNRTQLVAEKVYSAGTGEVETPPPAKSGGTKRATTTAAKPAAKSTKGNGAANGEDIAALTSAAIIAILEKATNNQLPRARVGVQILNAFKGRDYRDAAYALVKEEEFAALENGWNYDPTTQTLSLA